MLSGAPEGSKPRVRFKGDKKQALDEEMTEAAGDRFHKEKKDKGSVKLYPSPIPYGQWNDDDRINSAAKRRIKTYWHDKAKNKQWPKDLLSFEAWCGMTSYEVTDKKTDETYQTGGRPFQTLMGVLLAHPGSYNDEKAEELINNRIRAQPLTYNAYKRQYGPYYNNEEPIEDKLYQYTASAGNHVDAVQHLKDNPPATRELYKLPGMHTSVRSRPSQIPDTQKVNGVDDEEERTKPLSRPTGLESGWTGNQGDMFIVREGERKDTYGQKPFARIYGRFDWLRKGMFSGFGTFDGDQYGSLHNNAASIYTSVGVGSTFDSLSVLPTVRLERNKQVCNEGGTGSGDNYSTCVSKSNEVASIYGLYYYPGCNDPEYNWVVVQKVNGHNFRIRMRCPNPRYAMPKDVEKGFDEKGNMWFDHDPDNLESEQFNDDHMPLQENRLYVYEPLNPLNSQRLNEHFEDLIDEYNEKQAKAVRERTDPLPFLRYPATRLFVGGPKDFEVWQDGKASVIKGGKYNKNKQLQKLREDNEHTSLTEIKPEHLARFRLANLRYNYSRLQGMQGFANKAKFTSHWSFIGAGTLPGLKDKQIATGPFYKHEIKGIPQFTWYAANEDKDRKWPMKHFKLGDVLREANISVAEGSSHADLDFGYRISQAYLLFPHYYTEGDELRHFKDSRQAPKATDGIRRVEYQPLPKFKQNHEVLVKELEKASNRFPNTDVSMAEFLLNVDDYQQTDAEQFRNELLQTKGPVVATGAAGPSNAAPPADNDKTPVDVTETVLGELPPPDDEPGELPPDDTPPGETPASGELGLTMEVQDPNVEANNPGLGRAQVDQTTDPTINAAVAEEDTREKEGNIIGIGVSSVLWDCVSQSQEVKATDLPYTEEEVRRMQKRLLELNKNRSSIAKELTRLKYRDGTMESAKDFDRAKKLLEIMRQCNVVEKAALEPGSLHKDKKDDQDHFVSARHQPWPFEDCYDDPRLSFTYKDVNDTDPNTLGKVIDATSPAEMVIIKKEILKVSGVDVKWGNKKDVMDDLLTVNDDLHLMHLARILSIYCSPRGIRDKKKGFTNERKQDGMLFGLYRHKTATDPTEIITGRERTGRLDQYVKVFNPVFGIKDVVIDHRHAFNSWLQETDGFYDCLLTQNAEAATSNCHGLECCMKPKGIWHKPFKDKLEQLTSTMTVSEWVHTPWHLEHLPYREQYAIFKDGEGYADGCKRCSRPFYEYPYHVYADLQATQAKKRADGKDPLRQLSSWPYSLWYPFGRDSTQKAHAYDPLAAPRPLHDSIFFARPLRNYQTKRETENPPPSWLRAEQGAANYALSYGGNNSLTDEAYVKGKPNTRAATAQRRLVDDDGEVSKRGRRLVGDRGKGLAEDNALPPLPDDNSEFPFFTPGTMGWPSFLLQKFAETKDEERRSNLVENSPGGLYFRRYHNLAFNFTKVGTTNLEKRSLDDLDYEQRYYRKDYTQGYVITNANSKTRFGQTKLRTCRAFKYGNICRDCANVLERAPGLLVRNNRYQFASTAYAGPKGQQNTDIMYWTELAKGLQKRENMEDGLSVDAAIFASDVHKFYEHNMDQYVDLDDGAIVSRIDKSQKEARKRAQQGNRDRSGSKGVTQQYLEKWSERWLEAADNLGKGLELRHQPPPDWTKIVDVPDIHVQSIMGYSERRDRKLRQGEDGDEQQRQIVKEAMDVLNILRKLGDEDKENFGNQTLNDLGITHEMMQNVKLRESFFETRRRFLFLDAYTRVDVTKQFDSELKRIEFRNCTIQYRRNGRQNELWWCNPPDEYKKNLGSEIRLPLPKRRFSNLTQQRYITPKVGGADGETYYNCLIVDQYDPVTLTREKINKKELTVFQEAEDKQNEQQSLSRNERRMLTSQKMADYRMDVYIASRIGETGKQKRPHQEHEDDKTRRAFNTQWSGDGYITEQPEKDDVESYWKLQEGIQKHPFVNKQIRDRKQSRFMITYSLHRPITSQNQGRIILERMAGAVRTIFGEDKYLSEMVVMGMKLAKIPGNKTDDISQNMWETVTATRKAEAMKNFYGGGGRRDGESSYRYDTFETHIEKVDTVAGIEIGPKMGYPHFHCVLTLDHYSYVHFNYYKMNQLLEIAFKGINTHHGFEDKFYLPGGFYDDNERPYVDIHMVAEDRYKEVLACYVKKRTLPSIIEVEKARALSGTAENRAAAFADPPAD